MRRFQFFVIAVFLFSITIFAQDLFKVEEWGGVKIVSTPFAEVPVYSANLDREHEGVFTETGWNNNHSVFTVKTSLGEHATFSKNGNSWLYTNRLNGKIEEKTELSLVGKMAAWEIFQKIILQKLYKERMGVKNDRITVSSDSGMHTQNFFLPKGINYKIIQEEKVMLVWDSLGYNFTFNDFFGQTEGKYLVIYASYLKDKNLVIWSWGLEGLSSGCRDLSHFITEMTIPILANECENLGKNRYGEVEIKSTTDKSTIFYNREKRTARLGKVWENCGKIFHEKEFVVEDRGAKFKIVINGNSYSATKIN